MNVKKYIPLAAAALLCLTTLTGCAGGRDNTDTPESLTGQITVVSREDGSGTRGAFEELFEVEQTVKTAEIVNSTSTMATSVAGNKRAIGYVSLGALSDEVKALKIDGVAPSAAAVKDGSYKIARPFNVATKGEPTGLAADFLSFVMSPDGQKVVEDKGYVSEGAGAPYAASNLSGTLRISGSTSVYPVMEKLVEAYEAINAGVQIQLQQSDSTTGINDVLSGNIDIGMASRELKDSETDKGLLSKVIALDGIAVIVNKQNAAENMTAEQIRQIFTGEVTDWSSVQ